jgi:hypothetical protein
LPLSVRGYLSFVLSLIHISPQKGGGKEVILRSLRSGSIPEKTAKNFYKNAVK